MTVGTSDWSEDRRRQQQQQISMMIKAIKMITNRIMPTLPSTISTIQPAGQKLQWIYSVRNLQYNYCTIEAKKTEIN